MSRQVYVVGFLFNLDQTRVALIKKNRPAIQAGRWNGIGGHVEEGEIPHAAMQREFYEETGVWLVFNHYATLHSDEHVMHAYWAASDSYLERVRTTTDEIVMVWGEGTLTRMRRTGMLWPNVAWLIELAKDRSTVFTDACGSSYDEQRQLRERGLTL
jgi:8-oxo-dGTP diphosphatase